MQVLLKNNSYLLCRYLFIYNKITGLNQRIQVYWELRSLFQPPVQSRDSCMAEPGCLGLCPLRCGKHLKGKIVLSMKEFLHPAWTSHFHSYFLSLSLNHAAQWIPWLCLLDHLPVGSGRLLRDSSTTSSPGWTSHVPWPPHMGRVLWPDHFRGSN